MRDEGWPPQAGVVSHQPHALVRWSSWTRAPDAIRRSLSDPRGLTFIPFPETPMKPNTLIAAAVAALLVAPLSALAQDASSGIQPKAAGEKAGKSAETSGS